MRKLEVADALITAHQNALLQQPDPTLKGGLRVPTDLSGCNYSAEDWTNAWKFGANEFSDEYALSHDGHLPFTDNLKQCSDSTDSIRPLLNIGNWRGRVWSRRE